MLNRLAKRFNALLLFFNIAAGRMFKETLS